MTNCTDLLVEDLHLSLGTLGPEAGAFVARCISACDRWELVVAKCRAGEPVRRPAVFCYVGSGIRALHVVGFFLAGFSTFALAGSA